MKTKKRDLSRLIMLDMSPSESLVVAAALEMMRRRTFDQFEQHVLEGALLQIKLQLKTLAWPVNPERKAPFPL